MEWSFKPNKLSSEKNLKAFRDGDGRIRNFPSSFKVVTHLSFSTLQTAVVRNRYVSSLGNCSVSGGRVNGGVLSICFDPRRCFIHYPGVWKFSHCPRLFCLGLANRSRGPVVRPQRPQAKVGLVRPQAKVDSLKPQEVSVWHRKSWRFRLLLRLLHRRCSFLGLLRRRGRTTPTVQLSGL